MIPSIEWAIDHTETEEQEMRRIYEAMSDDEKYTMAYVKATNELKYLYIHVLKKAGFDPTGSFTPPNGKKNYQRMLGVMTGNRISLDDYVSLFLGYGRTEGFKLAKEISAIYGIAEDAPSNRSNVAFTSVRFHARSFNWIDKYRKTSGADSYLAALFSGVPIADIIA